MKIYVAYIYTKGERTVGAGDLIAEIGGFPPTEEDIHRIKSLVAQVCSLTKERVIINSFVPMAEAI